MSKSDFVHRMERLLAERRAFVTATVVRAAKPTSVRPGDAALILPDGTIDGFVGGHCAQASVRLHAARVLETGDAVLLRLVPGLAPGEEDGCAHDGIVVAHNPCLSGGALEIFLEPQLAAPRIVIKGDTPLARALEAVAGAAGYDVVRDEQPRASDAAVVVASHGIDEEPVLARALEAGVGYVGLVASRRRGDAVRASLDVDAVQRAKLPSPDGLEIGARTPAENAVSILAEIFAGRTAHATAGGLDAPALAMAHARPATASATDPVCGMRVPASDATPHLDVDGERFYFCCEGCRDTYAARVA
jgi:xanthine dehydrogenase accessory factor